MFNEVLYIRHRMHKFEIDNQMYVVDIDCQQVRALNSLCWNIIELYGTHEPEEIQKRLSTIYSQDEIEQAIEEIQAAVDGGLFYHKADGENTKWDSMSILPSIGRDEKKLKIFVPEGLSQNILRKLTYEAGGHTIASHMLAKHLAQYANIFIVGHRLRQVDDGIYEVPVSGADLTRMEVHVLENDYDAIYLPYALRAAEYLRRLRPYMIPIIVRVGSPRGQGGLWINRILETHAMLRPYDAIICPTQSIKGFYSRYVLDSGCFHVIPNGVDTNLFRPMDKTEARLKVAEILNEPRILEGRIVGFFSRFQLEKGANIYTKLAYLHPDVTFLILAPTLGLYPGYELPSNAIYAGHRIRDELPLFINTFDIHCFPSIVGEEGFGNAALEAMACGVPTIVPRFAGLPDVVADGGVIVDADEFESEIGSFAGYVCPYALSNVIRELLDSPGKLSELGQRARQRALNFSYDKTAQATVDLIHTLQRERDVMRLTPFTVRFAPWQGKKEQWGSLLINETLTDLQPLMKPAYYQSLLEGIALSLIRHHTEHEIENVLLSLCSTRQEAADIMRRIRGFLRATSMTEYEQFVHFRYQINEGKNDNVHSADYTP